MMVPKPVLALAAKTEVVAATQAVGVSVPAAGSIEAFLIAESARITGEIWEQRYRSAYIELANTKTYETK